jgi:hypothetical protein
MKKKGAVELSIGTIVIIVLAMSMLILGLVLVKNIFEGSTNNVDQLNDKVRDEIGKLFGENKRTVIYLSNQKAPIKQGEEWGVAFGIKNLIRGSSEAKQFSYKVTLSDPEEVRENCQISEADASKWIILGRTGKIVIAPGEAYFGIVRLRIPENAPLCMIRYNIEVTEGSNAYYTDFFDVEVR